MQLLDSLRALDHSLFRLGNGAAGRPWLDPLMCWITDSTSLLLLLLTGLGLFLLRARDRRLALACVLLALLTFALADAGSHRLLKPLFDRPRPCNPAYFHNGVHSIFPHGRFLLGMSTTRSFPSTHAVNLFAQAALWSGLYPRWRTLFLGFAAWVAYSRVYVGVHYPADLLAGALAGAALGWAMLRLGRRWVGPLRDAGARAGAERGR
jgi:undecaprenyl-diphosphatase